MFFHSISFEISTNHWWRGAAPSFVINATIPGKCHITFTPEVALNHVTLRIRIADEIDWMIRYFIIFSLSFFVLDFWVVKTQNDNVLISKKIQMAIHEFMNIHSTEEEISVILATTFVLIYLSNCKFEYFWKNCSKIYFCILCFEDT